MSDQLARLRAAVDAAREYVYKSSRFEPDNVYQARLKLAIDALDAEAGEPEPRTIENTCLHTISDGGICVKPLGHFGPHGGPEEPKPSPSDARELRHAIRDALMAMSENRASAIKCGAVADTILAAIREGDGDVMLQATTQDRDCAHADNEKFTEIDDTVDALTARVAALESVLRRVLANNHHILVGGYAWCSELIAEITPAAGDSRTPDNVSPVQPSHESQGGLSDARYLHVEGTPPNPPTTTTVATTGDPTYPSEAALNAARDGMPLLTDCLCRAYAIDGPRMRVEEVRAFAAWLDEDGFVVRSASCPDIASVADRYLREHGL